MDLIAYKEYRGVKIQTYKKAWSFEYEGREFGDIDNINQAYTLIDELIDGTTG